jgi:transcriptional regulator with XRE-family HTH domain
MNNIIQILKNQSEPLTLIKVLNHLMRKANISVHQLSKNTGLSNTTVKRMCFDQDSNPTLTSITKISEFFNITPNQLIGIEPLVSESVAYRANFNAWTNVPILSLKQVMLWPDNIETIKESSDTRFIKTDVHTNEHVFSIIEKEGALEPRFPEGTVLIFDSERTSPQNKDFVLLISKNKDLPQFRQILIDGSDMYVKSINPEIKDFPTLIDASTTKIIATLIQARSDFFA